MTLLNTTKNNPLTLSRVTEAVLTEDQELEGEEIKLDPNKRDPNKDNPLAYNWHIDTTHLSRETQNYRRAPYYNTRGGGYARVRVAIHSYVSLSRHRTAQATSASVQQTQLSDPVTTKTWIQQARTGSPTQNNNDLANLPWSNALWQPRPIYPQQQTTKLTLTIDQSLNNVLPVACGDIPQKLLPWTPPRLKCIGLIENGGYLMVFKKTKHTSSFFSIYQCNKFLREAQPRIQVKDSLAVCQEKKQC